MSGTSDRAKRYCDRANECLQIISTSQTPGTGSIHLQIAEHYLLLATSEKGKASGRTSNHSPTETVLIDTIVPASCPSLQGQHEAVDIADWKLGEAPRDSEELVTILKSSR